MKTPRPSSERAPGARLNYNTLIHSLTYRGLTHSHELHRYGHYCMAENGGVSTGIGYGFNWKAGVDR